MHRVAPLDFNYTTRKGLKSIGNRKTTTSTEVKQRWEAKAYKKYLVRLRADDDNELIQLIENNKSKYGTTELFRLGLEKLKKEGF